jgi:hypothetical protein
MSTVTNRSYVVAVNQHHHDKNRKFLRIILIFVGIIILLAALFLAIVIYRTLKTGAIFLLFSYLSVFIYYSKKNIIGIQRKSLSTFDSNNTEFIYSRFNKKKSLLINYFFCI